MSIKSDLRIGMGFDTHRLGEDRPLILGGVEIPFDKGLIGHSDADVLLHAITDAVLGAMGAGDIGDWFPNTDAENLNRDSKEMLQIVMDQAVQQKGTIVNLDCTVFAERPKLFQWKKTIAASIAEAMNLDSSSVNVKAKSGEAVGPVGRGESIDAHAIVLIQLNPS